MSNPLTPPPASRVPTEDSQEETHRDVPYACVPIAVADHLAARCSTTMTGHLWSTDNVRAAREVMSGPDAEDLVEWMADRLSRHPEASPGWAVLALPPEMNDADLQRAAAGVLAALGRPFFSIPSASWLWIGQESSSEREPASFGGAGNQRLHIDAPNVERIPDYTSLLILRPDPAGGGASLVGDLQAAMAALSEDDRVQLARPVFFEGRADGLCGVGAPRMPFPVLDATGKGRAWIRWAGKMLDDPRNPVDVVPVLRRFADALATRAHELPLERGQLLIVDQQRVAHGRTALGDQTSLPDGNRRLLLQAKISCEQTAPAQTSSRGGHGE